MNSGSASTFKPPFFDGKVSYSYWKNRMRTWLLSQGLQIWITVEKGYKHPVDSVTGEPKSFDKLSIVEADACVNNQKP